MEGAHAVARVTTKGQITLPRAVRDALGLQAGDEVELRIEGGAAILRRCIAEATFTRWRGALRGETGAVPTSTLIQDLRGE
ncbi:MAG TPA: AbrB/MazE/SpoVT family DNA-binding domain-containing protein [Chloroflexota bacterium]|nr:AbrB/MazE/SpoVT family DNA-binding domain-containing protein [Chloroflexota bacterium]